MTKKLEINDNPATKKKMRAYRKMVRRHQRKLVKLAKHLYPHDYSYFYDMTVAMVEFYYEYYNEGNNVWQTDETRLPTVNSLKAILDFIENEDKGLTDFRVEDTYFKKFFELIGENITMWWD